MFQLSSDGKNKILEFLKRYETKRSAIIPALYIAQEENKGWISPDVVMQLSQVMDIPMSQINEVLTFYTMFNKKPVGRHHVQICTNVSCSMAGGHELADYLCEKLGVDVGETSKDGRFTVSKVECLGSCDTAPVVQVNISDYIENVDQSRLDKLVNELK